MSATWHPLSALFVPDPPVLATRMVLTLLLRGGRPAEIVYAGDRMGPAIPHGSRVRISAVEPGEVEAGQVVLCTHGPPDLVRVERKDRDRFWVAADADPAPATEVAGRDVLAVTDLPRRVAGPRRRRWHRLTADLREAWTGRPDPGGDPAGTVRSKYAAQSAFYAASEDDALPAALRERIREAIPAGAAVLVAGAGAGREAVILASAGYRVRGVDFAQEMVDQARARAAREGVDAEFVREDLRRHREPEGSLDAVFFTYDVYSFLPDAAERVETLRRLRHWLRPGGVVFLSARLLRRGRDAGILALSWVARGGSAPFGDSHTRWIGPDGELRRSFVHVFPRRHLAREIAAAGFRAGRWIGGHVDLRATEGTG